MNVEHALRLTIHTTKVNPASFAPNQAPDAHPLANDFQCSSEDTLSQRSHRK